MFGPGMLNSALLRLRSAHPHLACALNQHSLVIKARGAGALSGDGGMWIWAEYEFVVPRIKLLRRTPLISLGNLGYVASI
jgi:hypothetical protein